LGRNRHGGIDRVRIATLAAASWRDRRGDRLLLRGSFASLFLPNVVKYLPFNLANAASGARGSAEVRWRRRGDGFDAAVSDLALLLVPPG